MSASATTGAPGLWVRIVTDRGPFWHDGLPAATGRPLKRDEIVRLPPDLAGLLEERGWAERLNEAPYIEGNIPRQAGSPADAAKSLPASTARVSRLPAAPVPVVPVPAAPIPAEPKSARRGRKGAAPAGGSAS